MIRALSIVLSKYQTERRLEEADPALFTHHLTYTLFPFDLIDVF